MTPRDNLAEKIAEIEARQDEALAELERLEQRIAQVIAECNSVIHPPVTVVSAPAAAAA